MSRSLKNHALVVAAVVVAGTLGWGCHDAGITGPQTSDESRGLIVSSPMLSPPASAAARGALANVLASQESLTYVSLVPGTAQGGVSATIRNIRKAGAMPKTVFVIEGGFDPVAIVARLGDTIEVAVTDAASAVVFQAVALVRSPRRPVVVRTSPPARKTDVPLNIIMDVVFSAPIDSTTLTTASVQLWRGAQAIAGTVRFGDAEHLRAEFHADGALASETAYELVVTSAILDVNGLPLDSAVTVPFTTGTARTIGNLVFASVSAGLQHACGVTTTGAAYCWGDNYTGALGDGTMDYNSSIPVPVAGGLTFATVSAGAFHTCGVTTSGAAYCWGVGGQLGDSLGSWSNTPVRVAGGLTFASVSTGFINTCGVTTAGAAYCWGSGYYGELGGGSTYPGSALMPQAVAGGLTFANVSAGNGHSCGVTTEGNAYCWGQNTLGELGIGTSTGPDRCINGDTLACSTLPVPVSGGLTFATVTAGGNGTCGVTTGGAAYCWGSGLRGLVGPVEQCELVLWMDWIVGPIPCSRVPVAVVGGLALTSVAVSDQDAGGCGLASAGVGAGECWGQWGLTTPGAGGLTFATLSAGSWSICGVTTAGVAYCWGANSRGQLGDGTTNFSPAPVKVAGQP